ncbi:hypothetical protein IE979_29425 [Klebsiella pneumoniae]|uniref:Uncharacterized protein n=1 Tax=Klebsiella pneumoniae TaxID=573 RepID=A0A927DT83_KLEPN|nr:hypothetical protein [Klebsiella pneumoniae]
MAFVIRTLRHPQPVMDLRALQDRTFSLGCYFSFMAGVGIFATIYLTPLYLGSVRGFSALEIGPGGIFHRLVPVMSIPFYSWLANRVDLRWLLMAGLIGFAVSMYSFAPITHDWGGGPVASPAGFSRTGAAVCRRANGDPDAGQPAARAPEVGLRAV